MPEIKCPRCLRPYPADEYVLDYRYKMVVCPQCAKEKDPVKKPEPSPQSEIVHKAERLVNPVYTDKVKVRCKKCKFEFKYDEERKIPARCPYCSAQVIF